MRPVVKKGCLFTLATISVVVIAAAILLHPYYAMPPESTTTLDAKLAEYRAVADEMKNRPKADREMMDALINDSKSITEAKLASENCPAYDLAQLQKSEAEIRANLALDERFRAFADHGPVLQVDYLFLEHIPDLLGILHLTSWENVAAVLDLQHDRRDEAMRRFHSLIRFMESMFQTQQVVYPAVAMAAAMKLDQTLVYLLPRLTPEEIAQLKDWLAKLPDSRQALVTSLKTEVATVDDSIEVMIGSPRGNAIVAQQKWTPGVWGRLVRISGFFTREKYKFLSLKTHEVAAAQAWAASPDYRPYQPPPDQDKMERHLFSWVAENVLTRMFPKAVDDMLHRQALIKAMDLELQRRAKRQQTFELPYDAEHHIVVKPEYGCIVKNEGAAGARH